MKRFLPYFKYLRVVRWPFAVGVIAGLVNAMASGLGIPLMAKFVLPIIFPDERKGPKVPGAALQDWLDKYEQSLPSVASIVRGVMGMIVGLAHKLEGLSHDQLLLYASIWIPVIFLIRSISDYTNSYFIQYSGQRVLEDIRFDLFVKLQQLPLSFFKSNKSGDLLARLMSDTAILRQIVANVSSDMIKQPATLLFALGGLLIQAILSRSVFIALIAMSSVPVCVLIIRSAGKRLERRAKSLQQKGGSMTAALSETLLAPLEIRAYNLQDQQISAFRKRTSEMLKLGMKVVKYRQAISPSIEVVSAVGLAFALYLGARAHMGQDEFITLFLTMYMCYEPIKKLGLIHSQFKQANAAVERIEFISKEPDSLPDPASPVPAPAPREAIRFENLSFAYGDEPVLRDISVRIPVGQVVALVGPSGAGKSTFAHLIPRFYDPRAGAITFDGTDIRDFAKKDLRNLIAVVPQMPSLFQGTIASNIRIGRAGATDEEVRAAAMKANAHDFIESLPEGYQTQVGERGDLLSGGQRQRIAIARAFLKDAPILILDEATSALDSESEAMVQQALAALVKGRTTFIIAHRFSTITIADRVLVFQAGRIVGDGNHESLRETDAIYRGMLGNQMAGSVL